jgi:hypothetical protein
MKFKVSLRKSALLILLFLGLIVAAFYFIFLRKVEETGRISFDYISRGSVLYEVFIADDGNKYLLSWKGHDKPEDDLRSISTDLSYLPPYGNLRLTIEGYRGFSLFPVNLSKYGHLLRFNMTGFQVLNTIDELPSKNVYICLENNDLKAFYLYDRGEERSGSMGPTSFELEFPRNEKEKLIDLLIKLISISENCKSTPDVCDRDPKVCDLAKVDSRYSRCSNLYLECREGTSSAVRLNALGRGYFVKNSIVPRFQVKSYDINDLGGAYSSLIKDFKSQLK